MTRKIDISVIIPNYNSGNGLQRALHSILDQENHSFSLEIIIIDDGSEDNSIELIQEVILENNFIKLIKLGENFGVHYARNVGLDAASGEYIAFCDSDDYWLQGKLAYQMPYFDKGHYICVSHLAKFEINGSIKGLWLRPENYSLENLTYENPIIMSSLIIYREAISSIRFKAIEHEDYIFWYEVFLNGGSGLCIQKPFSVYHVSNNGVSGGKIRSILKYFKSQRYLGFSSIQITLNFQKRLFHNLSRKIKSYLKSLQIR